MRSNQTAGQRRGAAVQQATNPVANQFMERLETRQMLSGSVFSLKNAASFTPTTASLADAKNGPLAKGGSALVALYNEYSKFVKKGGNRYQFQSSLTDLYSVKGRDVLVTLRGTGTVDEMTQIVRDAGGKVVYRSKSRGFVQAYVPLNYAPAIASRSDVLNLRPMLKSKTSSVGSVLNPAERALRSEYVLPAFGADGSGQKVGVISDSYGSDAADIISGDLPDNVQVLADQAANNEGRAMAQLIHDIVPGADLAFHTVGDSPSAFAEAIYNLREAGSSVIVDDVAFYAEPYFGGGVVDKAIDAVREDGAVYLTANGNSDFNGYETGTSWVTDPGGTGKLINDWDSSGGVDTTLSMHIDHAGYLFFQWDDAYDGEVGNVTADVDFFVYRKGTLVAQGIDDNFATGVPMEQIPVFDTGDLDIVIRVNKLAKGATAPTRVKFIAPDPMFDGRSAEYAGNVSSTWGHTIAEGAIAVGAVDAATTEAYGYARGTNSDYFSSAGPSMRVFHSDGTRLETPVLAQTPLVSGVDGTDTSVTGFAPFYGTSAAAPHVAAIAALALSIDDTLTPDDIQDLLVESAKLHPLNGAAAGSYDIVGGYGLVDGLWIAQQLDDTVAVPSFSVPAVNAGKVSSINITFSRPVTGLDISDFTLIRDGTNVSRFRGGETVTTSDGGTTWTLGNLGTATGTLGTYTLILKPTGTGVLDEDDNPTAGNVVSFDVTLRKVRGLNATNLSSGDIQLSWDATATGGDKVRIQRATDKDFSQDIKNTDLGTDVASWIDTDLTPGQTYFYRVRALKNGRLGDKSEVSIVAGSTGEIYVDQTDASFRGGWATYAADSALFGTFARASATKELESPNTATFSSDQLVDGNYFIYIRYNANSKAATNARFQVYKGSKLATTVPIDQTKRGGGWVVLGNFANTSAQPLSLTLTSLLADGAVNIDAVRFLPADDQTVARVVEQKKKKNTGTTIDF